MFYNSPKEPYGEAIQKELEAIQDKDKEKIEKKKKKIDWKYWLIILIMFGICCVLYY